MVIRPRHVAQLRRAAVGQCLAREGVGTGQVVDHLADRHRRAVGTAEEAPVRHRGGHLRVVVGVGGGLLVGHARLGVVGQDGGLGAVVDRVVAGRRRGEVGVEARKALAEIEVDLELLVLVGQHRHVELVQRLGGLLRHPR
ncbi:hypothetical protein D3C86_1315260 [compost metagenome]